MSGFPYSWINDPYKSKNKVRGNYVRIGIASHRENGSDYLVFKHGNKVKGNYKVYKIIDRAKEEAKKQYNETDFQKLGKDVFIHCAFTAITLTGIPLPPGSEMILEEIFGNIFDLYIV